MRRYGEKPARVLRLIYTFGWLPALLTAALARPAAGPSYVLSGAGNTGRLAVLGLALSLAILTAGYVAAIRRPPDQGVLLAACLGSLAVMLAMPVLFSADVYAYAYYGDLALHGQNPYGHASTPLGDPLAAAAVAAWDGRVPPRCVYGPVAVFIAAAADAIGQTAAGARGAIAAQRLAAVAGYAAYIAAVLASVRDPRARAALLLNPVVIWNVAEGHNDAATVALVFSGLCVARFRLTGFVVAALVKAPAILAFGALRPVGLAIPALALTGLGYLPLIITFIGDIRISAPSTAAAIAVWQSPLGLVSALVGRPAALGLALAALATAAIALRGVASAERTAALALAGWFALPNAYPWYAVWLVPLAARRLDSIWSRALLVASISGAARVMLDAIFPAARTFATARTFYGWMIALEFLPPLCFLAFTTLSRRRAVIAAAIAGALVLTCPPADAQTVAPNPLPTPRPSTQPAPLPQPQPSAPTVPPPAPPPTPPAPPPTPPAPPVTPPATASPATASPATAPPATAKPATAPPTAASTVAPATPTPLATSVPPAAAVAATPNSFTYVITPTPVPVTTPDGPHIVEILLNDRRVHPGGPIIVRVLTSPNVVGVEARAMGRFIAIPQNSAGSFSLAYTLPGGIPFWLLNRNYDIVIAAATADGRQVTVSFPMLLTR